MRSSVSGSYLSQDSRGVRSQKGGFRRGHEVQFGGEGSTGTGVRWDVVTPVSEVLCSGAGSQGGTEDGGWSPDFVFGTQVK